MADGTGKPRPKLIATWGDKLTPRLINWLWKPLLQRGALNMITGHPGMGKSAVICALASAISRGDPLPGEDALKRREPAKVWIMNGEDGAEDTIIWRLNNQGADVSKVLVTDQACAITASITREMHEMCERHKFAMIVIDPLQAWMGADIDAHRANETRAWSSMLRKVAMEHNTAMVFVRHRRKGASTDATHLQSGMGSMDLSGAVRSELGFVLGKDGTRYITRIKGNVGPSDMCIAYDLERTENDHGKVVWGGLYDPTEAKAASKHSRVPMTVSLAKTWLRAYLLQGPKPTKQVFEDAAAAGHSESTLKRAKDGVAESIQGPCGWVWQLIADPRPPIGDDDGEA